MSRSSYFNNLDQSILDRYARLKKHFLSHDEFVNSWKPVQDLLFPLLADAPLVWFPSAPILSDQLQCTYLSTEHLTGNTFATINHRLRALGESDYAVIDYALVLRGNREGAIMPPHYRFSTDLNFEDLNPDRNFPDDVWAITHLPHAYIMYGQRDDWAVIGDEVLGISILAVKPNIMHYFEDIVHSDDLWFHTYLSGMTQWAGQENMEVSFYQNYITPHRSLFEQLRTHVPDLFSAFKERFSKGESENRTHVDYQKNRLTSQVTADVFEVISRQLVGFRSRDPVSYRRLFGEQELEIDCSFMGSNKLYSIRNLVTGFTIALIVVRKPKRTFLFDTFERPKIDNRPDR